MTRTIVIISEEYAQTLNGVEYAEKVQFNPLQLPDGRWFISLEESNFIDQNEIIETIEYEFENTEE